VGFKELESGKSYAGTLDLPPRMNRSAQSLICQSTSEALLQLPTVGGTMPIASQLACCNSAHPEQSGGCLLWLITD